jgi:hypothetical protein
MKILSRLIPAPFKLASVALIALSLASCASLDRDARLQPGRSDAAQVTALYGQPTRVWAEADGGRTLEYSSQPFGQSCYMVRLDAAGRLVAVEDTLRDETVRFAAIQPGMTPEQVSRRLGSERSRVFFPLSGEDVWDWNVPNGQRGYLLRFNVHFKDGRVLRTTESMVFPDRDNWLLDF